MKIFNTLFLAILLTGCGGGSADPAQPVIDNPNIVKTDLSKQIVRGTGCDLLNGDISSLASFFYFQKNNQQPYHCLSVHKSDGHPTQSGNYAFRFEIRPEDCTWNSGWNDCLNDRSRTEVEDSNNNINSYGKEIVWDYWMYIPEQTNFKPKGPTSALFVSQLLSFSSNNYFALAQMLITDDNKLSFRPTKQYSFISEGDINVMDNPYNVWINLRYEVKTSTETDGYLRMKINGKTIVNKTGPNVLDKDINLAFRLGIYNSFKSRAIEPYSTQVIYFDTVTKSIK